MKEASTLFLALAIVVSATFIFAADAQLRPGANLPASTGFAAQRQFQQGVPAGTSGHGAAGGFARGAANVPVPVGTGFATQGQLPQGMQAGAPGQGAGSLAQSVPGTLGTGSQGAGSLAQSVPGAGQQQGAGIYVGEQSGTDYRTTTSPQGPLSSAGTIGGGPGGPGTCYCITAPCNCGGAGSGPGQGIPAQVGGGGAPLNPQYSTQPGAVQGAGQPGPGQLALQ